MMVSVEFLELNGFELVQYPDGKFWLLYAHSDMFIQLNESRTDATLYDRGWVETGLTTVEIESIITQFKAKY